MIKDCPKRNPSFIQPKNQENLTTERVALKEDLMKTEKVIDPMEIMIVEVALIADPMDKEEIEEDIEEKEVIRVVTEEVTEETEEVATAADVIEGAILVAEVAAKTVIKEDTVLLEAPVQAADDLHFGTFNKISLISISDSIMT